VAQILSQSETASAPATALETPPTTATQPARCGARCQLILLLVSAALLFCMLAVGAQLFGASGDGTVLRPVAVLIATLGLCLLGLLGALLWRDFLLPLAQLHEWAERMRAGDLDARLPVPRRKEFAALAEDINSLALMLQQQSLATEQQLEAHTEHITQKNRDLAILYEVAASINEARSLDDVLARFLRSLRDVGSARAASVRLLDDNQNMLLAASLGIPEDIAEQERLLPAAHCTCGHAALGGEVIWQEAARRCTSIVELPLFSGENLITVAVPVHYRDQVLGAYSLFIHRDRLKRQPELNELFASLGQHLGVAIEKTRLDAEAQRLGIMQERASLSHELHDSLAQTLASLRFQLRVLGGEAPPALGGKLARIENTVDEANVELRELIGHFRAPINSRGLIPAIEHAVQRYREQTGRVAVLQSDWPALELPPATELQVLRIVQESLANARKHARADTVRVLLSDCGNGDLRVLVEDDGVGMAEPPGEGSGSLGEHIGLGIMAERARRIGGSLDVDSEPDDGTRIELTFHPDAAAAAAVVAAPITATGQGT